MLGLPIEAIMSQFTPLAAPAAVPTEKPKKTKKETMPRPHELPGAPSAAALAAKVTPDQQMKLLELQKQLEDPNVRMLVANGFIDPAAVCGLDAETAKLLGIAPPTTTSTKVRALI